jgi:hypothetical protein
LSPVPAYLAGWLAGWLQVQAEAEGATSLERAAKQVARERGALAALPEAAQGHALQVGRWWWLWLVGSAAANLFDLITL